jgi:RsiW-degrading membrane proteinase PrsW (M82 family)
VLIRWVALPFILRGLWNTLAYEFNLPTFNFVFFLGCVAAIHIFKFNPKANA